MRALIVEDDFISRRVMKELMAPLGECDTAIDGEDAVKAFRVALEEKRPYDLVFMDVMMPNMDGFGALDRIRDIEREFGVPCEREVKVIITTALDVPMALAQTLCRSGAVSCLTKPLTREKLFREIRSHGLV